MLPNWTLDMLAGSCNNNNNHNNKTDNEIAMQCTAHTARPNNIKTIDSPGRETTREIIVKKMMKTKRSRKIKPRQSKVESKEGKRRRRKKNDVKNERKLAINLYEWNGLRTHWAYNSEIWYRISSQFDVFFFFPHHMLQMH